MATRGQLARITAKLKARNQKTIAFRIPYSIETDKVEAMKAKAVKDNGLDKEGITVVFVVDYSLVA